MNDKAWIANAAKQPMVLETVDLGPLGPRTLKSRSNIAVYVTPISPS
jgi:hypothetical protein